MIALDTSLLSELTRQAPDTTVLVWLDSLPAAEVRTTAITAAELLYGVARLPRGRRKTRCLWSPACRPAHRVRPAGSGRVPARVDHVSGGAVGSGRTACSGAPAGRSRTPMRAMAPVWHGARIASPTQPDRPGGRHPATRRPAGPSPPHWHRPATADTRIVPDG